MKREREREMASKVKGKEPPEAEHCER